MNVPIRTADIPADAPRWTDKSGAVWAEVGDDHLAVVEHNGQPVPFADAIPRRVVVRQNGQLTAVATPVVEAYRQHPTAERDAEVARLSDGVSLANARIANLSAEVYQYQRIRDLLVRAVAVAVEPLGISQTAVEEGPLTQAMKVRDEIEKLRAQVAQLTRLHDERDAIERGRLTANLTVMADTLDKLADEMAEKQQWMREEDNRTIRSSGLGEGVRMARARAIALRVTPAAPGVEEVAPPTA